MKGNFDSLIAKLTEYLEYEIDEGHRQHEVPKGILSLLRLPPPRRETIPETGNQISANSGIISEIVKKTETSSGQTTMQTLTEIAGEVASCTRCRLHVQRKQAVPGDGNPEAELMFIGEGPGAEEDLQGIPFVGRAGQLLTRMIQAMGLDRKDVFIANIVKCRPPDNRTPMPDEMSACMPFLKNQISLIKPKVIVALGATATRGLTGIETSIGKLRGNWISFAGVALMPTFHPAYLLRNPHAKHDAWEDLKMVLAKLGRPVPEHKKQSDRK